MVGIATKEARPNLHYDLINPESQINYGCPQMGWRYGPETMNRMIEEGRILWPTNPDGRPRAKNFFAELKDKYTGYSSIAGEGIYTRNGTATINDIFGERKFDFPKPFELIEQFIEQATEPGDLVLDSFAGSGTTGHAVLNHNRQNEEARSYRVCRIKPSICFTLNIRRF